MKIKLLLPLLVLAGSAFAQNLVPNPGFETQDDCPGPSDIAFAVPWGNPNLATADLFNSSCPSQNASARTGIGSAGVFTTGILGQPYREYVQAPLDAPLVAGQVYNVSFYVLRAGFRYASNGMGAYFGTSETNESTSSGLFALTPQVQSLDVIENSSSWTEISGSFTAAGGESWIIIGNFLDDSEVTITEPTTSSDDSVAFYRIDDISVIGPGGTSFVGSTLLDQASVYPNPASDMIRIRLNASVPTDARLLVFSADGRLHHEASVEQQREISIGSYDWPEGMYIVQLQYGGRSESASVLIAH